MKAFKHIFTAILACVTFAALAESAKLELVLLQAIPSDAVDGRIVQLQTLGSSGCRYVGALKSATHTVDGLGDKIVGAAIGNTDRFIKVTRKGWSEQLTTNWGSKLVVFRSWNFTRKLLKSDHFFCRFERF